MDQREILRLLPFSAPFGDEHPRPRDRHRRADAGLRTPSSDVFDGQDTGQRVAALAAKLHRQTDTQDAQLSEQAHVIDRMSVFVAALESLWLEALGPDTINQIYQFLIFF